MVENKMKKNVKFYKKNNTKLTPFYKEFQESKADVPPLTILITHNKLELNINFLDFNNVNLDLIILLMYY